MSVEGILQELTPIFQEVFDDGQLVVTETLSANEIPQWDSLSYVQLLVTIEQRLQVKFNASEVGELKDVSDLVRAIVAKRSG
ncbi:MAG: acyl carrier protein [Magnetococcales bacterium]|nr:acyl carrier protein [Magnetococcales bacterium]